MNSPRVLPGQRLDAIADHLEADRRRIARRQHWRRIRLWLTRQLWLR